jgi:sarcosine oxidase
MHIAVIGAGAFGGWTALNLLRQGVQVTLVDSWGPGNSRASSGGETRIIRASYGTDFVSTRFTIRALQLWKEQELRWQTSLYQRTGMLFLGGPRDEFLDASQHALEEAAVSVMRWTAAEARKRYPQVNFSGVDSVLYEPDAGALWARENCRTVLKHFLAEGGNFQLASIAPLRLIGDLQKLDLSNNTLIRADQYVFACGPWMARIFPDVMGNVIRPSRQDVLFFATPPGDASFGADSLPCWADRTAGSRFYGIPDLQFRGFKIASDLRGPTVDPDAYDRLIEEHSRVHATEFLRMRFPALANAPVLETRVCQYENTPDLKFVIDRHPAAGNVWVVAGGSGHGYKQGPAVGEYVAGLVTGSVKAIPEFGFKRFERITQHPVSSF